MKSIINKIAQLIDSMSVQEKKEDKTSQHEAEFKSFIKKFEGKKLIWFLSLNESRQYDLFYEWKQYKYSRRDIKKVILQKRKVYDYFTGRSEVKTVKLYPASFKHFISQKMKTKKYFVNISKIRDTSLKVLMNEL